MNTKSCSPWAMRTSTLLLAVIMTLAVCVLTVNAAPEEETGQITKLEDYTDMYGWTPSDSHQRVKVNPYLRSNAPMQAAYLAVFIEFPDCPSTHLDDEESLKAAELILNAGGEVTVVGGTHMTVPSLRQCVEKTTYGKITTQSYIFPKESAGSSKVVSFEAKHPRSYYMAYSSKYPDGYKDTAEKSRREAELIAEAVKTVSSQVSAAGISASQLDSDNDGTVDAISFFAEGGLDDVK